MFCWRIFPRNCFTSLLCLSWSLGLPPFIEKRLIFPRRLDFVLDFLTEAWFCNRGWSESFCTSFSLLLGLWHHLSAMKMTLSTRFIISSSSWSKGFPSKTYLIPLQCYIISLQQRYTQLFICLDSLTWRYLFVYIYWHKDIHRNVITGWAKDQDFVECRGTHHAQSVALIHSLGLQGFVHSKAFSFVLFFSLPQLPRSTYCYRVSAMHIANVKVLILLLHWS